MKVHRLFNPVSSHPTSFRSVATRRLEIPGLATRLSRNPKVVVRVYHAVITAENMKIPGENVTHFRTSIPGLIIPPLPSAADNNKLNREAVYAGFSPLSGRLNATSDPYLSSPLQRLHTRAPSGSHSTHKGSRRATRIAKLSESPRSLSEAPMELLRGGDIAGDFARELRDMTQRQVCSAKSAIFYKARFYIYKIHTSRKVI